MTPNEFKAWFDGFTEAFENRIPTKAQWGRIKERVAEIDGKRVTETVYVDRYVRTSPYWHYLAAAGGGVVSNTYAGLQNTMGQAQCATANSLSTLGPNSNALAALGQNYQAVAQNSYNESFNSLDAMNELGRAEARGVA